MEDNDVNDQEITVQNMIWEIWQDDTPPKSTSELTHSTACDPNKTLLEIILRCPLLLFH